MATAAELARYLILNIGGHFDDHPLPVGTRVVWSGEGEWKITLDVFRDLGIAFSVALLGIYVLLVYETTSYLLPVIIMLSIPLTMIGIMPGFWAMNQFGDRVIAGAPEQVADAMEAWVDGGAADGFNVMPLLLPHMLDVFADEVVPILQRRGRFRTAYEGTTLRDHYKLDRPST